jgi:hypothetical protein
MLLREMFSPIGAPNETGDDIDWLGDLKFFIDNDDKLLNRHFFPSIKKHQQHKGHPEAFKLYLRPIEESLVEYCNKYDIEDKEEKFPKEKLIELAKRFSQEQERHIERGDYED